MTRFFVIFSILFGIIHTVCCENHSVNRSSFQVNHKTESENPKPLHLHTFNGNLLESPLQKKIKEKRRLLFGEDSSHSTINPDRGENIEFSPGRSNFTEVENEKMSDWGNLRFQFPIPVSENSHNFPDFSTRQPFMRVKNPNHRFDWEKKNDFFEKTSSRWNDEKKLRDFYNHDVSARNHYNGRYGGVLNDGEMNREDRRGDVFDRRVSITTLNDGEIGNMKNYNDDRVSSIHSGHLAHSNMNYLNRHPNTFWNPNFFKPEKELVINLKTECSTPREINNQLVHKFIYTPKSPLAMQSGLSGYQIPEPGYVSSHKMTPMYYL